MRVHVVDPSAYTPPYDHALCSALWAADTEVDLFTSRFPYGALPEPQGYRRHEFFYRAAFGPPGGRLRRLSKLAQHVPDMLRYRRAAQAAEIVHFQWLAVQHLDRYLLPARHSRSAGRLPLVLTAHDVLPREPRPAQRLAQRRLYDHFDAIVVHSEHGRTRLIEELGVDGERVHVIPHGAFAHLAPQNPKQPRTLHETPEASASQAPVPASEEGGRPKEDGRPGAHESVPDQSKDPLVVLMFGLMRPYKGIDVLLEAWRSLGEEDSSLAGAELWIVGLARMDISALRAAAPTSVRFVERFVEDAELATYFTRADLVVLPYLQADQSGVLFTALAFGKPLLLSDVGGFPEMAATGAARIVAAGDAHALGQALRELLVDRALLRAMSASARTAAAGRYSWRSIALAHLELYERLLQAGPPH